MIDLDFIRQNPKALDDNQKLRGKNPKSEKILALDTKHRGIITELQQLQADRNKLAREIGGLLKDGSDATEAKAKAEEIKQQIAKLEDAAVAVKCDLELILHKLANILSEKVPVGESEQDNVFVRTWGKIPEFNFTAEPHYALGEKLGLMDFETAAQLSGARFVVLKGAMARLERALAQFMLDQHTSGFGYQEIYGPLLVKAQTLFGTGQLPKMHDDLFLTNADLYLIPTSEVILTNLVANKFLDAEQLPLRFTAYTPNFRKEAGAAGKDTRGMIRQHQFGKVELVSIVHPESGEAELDRMLSAAENILQKLKLPYRVVELCSGDIGFQAKRTFDLEVWLPGQNTFREISSCSWCGDFQSRRMQCKIGKEKLFVHTLNGSGVAVGRTLVAVLENYQQADGSIIVPEVLQPYMNMETICAS